MTKRRDITKALQAASFISKGGTNHETWVHPDGRRTVLGRHKEIPSPTARLIAKQAKIELPK
jgi:predicted RNA binding protein YcfA (HicA-like mRNA interferase family)